MKIARKNERLEAYQHHGFPTTLQTVKGRIAVKDGDWVVTHSSGAKTVVREGRFRQCYDTVNEELE